MAKFSSGFWLVGLVRILMPTWQRPGLAWILLLMSDWCFCVTMHRNGNGLSERLERRDESIKNETTDKQTHTQVVVPRRDLSLPFHLLVLSSFISHIPLE